MKTPDERGVVASSTANGRKPRRSRRLMHLAALVLLVSAALATEAGEFFEEERLQELLVSMPGRPASEIRDRLLEEVARFSGSEPQADDITLVVARLL